MSLAAYADSFGEPKEFVVVKDQGFGSQSLLGAIEEVLKKAEVKTSELTEIKVETGPGSFTGLRVGVSVANALGYALGIPVNGKESETEIRYS